MPLDIESTMHPPCTGNSHCFYKCEKCTVNTSDEPNRRRSVRVPGQGLCTAEVGPVADDAVRQIIIERRLSRRLATTPHPFEVVWPSAPPASAPCSAETELSVGCQTALLIETLRPSDGIFHHLRSRVRDPPHCTCGRFLRANHHPGCRLSSPLAELIALGHAISRLCNAALECTIQCLR